MKPLVGPHASPGKALKRITHVIARADTHGFQDDNLPMPELRRKLRAGEHIVASCGTMARLGTKELKAAGVPARVVGTVTREARNGNDGHIMLEAQPNKRKPWQVYDIDMNRQPLDRRGRPMNIQQFTKQGYSGRSRSLANDPAYQVDDPYFLQNPEKPEEWGLNDPGRFYGRVLGTPWVAPKNMASNASILYRDRTNPNMIGPGYTQVNKRQWRKLMGLGAAMKKHGLNP